METSEMTQPASASRQTVRSGMRFAALFGITSMCAAAWLGAVAGAVGLLAGDGQVLYGWDAFWPVFTMVNTANAMVMLSIVTIVGMIAWAERRHP
jgi:carbon starvation protein CstA